MNSNGLQKCQDGQNCFICNPKIINTNSLFTPILQKSDSIEENKPKPVVMKYESATLPTTPKRKSPKTRKLNLYATRSNKSPGKVQPIRAKNVKSHLEKFLIEQQKHTSLSQQFSEDIC